MVQPALKSAAVAEMPRPHSLTQRLEAELVAAAGIEPTVSSMAERFAPAGSRTAPDASRRPFAGDAGFAGQPRKARRFTLPSRGVVLVLSAVALAPAAILAGLLWLGIRGPDGAFDFSLRSAAPVQQAAVAPTPALPSPLAAEIALTAPEEIMAKAGEEVAFTIAIDAAGTLPERSVIAIHDLPKGTTFSEGRPYGDTEWSLRPDEIAGLTLQLPNTGIGASDLRVELVAADGAVLARTVTSLDVTSSQAPLVTRPGEAGRVEDLIAHGNAMIAVGYLAGARAYFERAADAGSGAAALALGATYDPAFIAELGVQGIKPNPGAAESWYARAAALGVTNREAELARLKRAWAQGDAAQVEPVVATPEEAAPTPVEQAPQAKPQEEQKPGPIGRLVAAAAELTIKPQWVEVSSAVNLREGASGTAKTLKVVQRGTKLRVKGREGNWVQVANPATSEEGWIYTRFLKETEAP